MTKPVRRLHEMAKLESFDPKVFIGSDPALQKVCNFVLALSLIFNDFRDLLHIHEVIISDRPDDKLRISRHGGNYSGVLIHLIRLMLGLAHELLELIRDNKSVLENALFQQVIKQLDEKDRNYWQDLVNTACGIKTDSAIGEFAKIMRNKIGYHYNTQEIYTGYKKFFNSTDGNKSKAYVSRGANMAESRFYFADAAVSEYLRKSIQSKPGDEIVKEISEILSNLNFALRGIVDHFILKCGGAYKSEKDN